MRSHRHVVVLSDLGGEVKLDTWTEDQAVSRATEVEHTDLVTLLDLVAGLHSDVAGGDLGHTDTDESHEADVWVVGLDEDDTAGGGGSQVALTAGRTRHVDLLNGRVTDTLEERL